MRIQVFAILKDYFDEVFEIENTQAGSISELKNELIKVNESATSVLNSCRFAVNETFVPGDYQLKEDEHIYIIPPSSGG